MPCLREKQRKDLTVTEEGSRTLEKIVFMKIYICVSHAMA